MKRCLKYLVLILIFSHCANDNQEDSIINNNRINHNQTKKEELLKSNVAKQNRSSLQSSNQEPSNFPHRNFSHRKYQKKIEPLTTEIRRNDSLLIKKIQFLKKEHIEIDLNEPLSKEFLLSFIQNTKFPSFLQLSNESFFVINFDNDILDYTDRFYTNGIRFDLIAPIFHQSPLSRLLLPYWRRGINYYGISLVQNIYTPSTTKEDKILYEDRPYSSYLYFGSFKITNDPIGHFRQRSELDLGIIGPNACGESVQKSFHSGVPPNSEPLGWEYQIKNDFILNYSVMMERGLYQRNNLEFIGMGSSNIGSLYTNLSCGFRFRVGLINPYFSNLGISKRQKNKVDGLRNTQSFFFVTGNGKLVGYDATLQGGLFNKASTYFITGSDISRFTFQGTAGLSVTFSGLKLDVEQFLLSPEFHRGWWHKWVHIAFTFAL